MATGGKKEIGSNLLNVGTLILKPDNLDCWGVVVVVDKLVITDRKSNKVHVYRRHDGKKLSSSDRLESRPHGVCCVNDTDLCLAMDNGTITFISIQDSGLVSRVTTFDLRPSFDYCDDVAAFRDNVVVSGVKDNTICWSFVSLQDGRLDNVNKVCGGTRSFMTTKQNMVYISCAAKSSDSHDSDGIYGFNLLNPSQPPYTYKRKGLWPSGITVDDNGYLFVCDWYNSIHHLTDKCELVAIYTEGITRAPFSIFWYRGIVYVTEWLSNVITMYDTLPQVMPFDWHIPYDMNKHHVVSSVPFNVLKEKPSERQLGRLSMKIGNKLFRLGIELGLSGANIQQIQKDYHGTATQCLKILVKWKELCGDKASFGNLEKAFKSVDIDVDIFNSIETSEDLVPCHHLAVLDNQPNDQQLNRICSSIETGHVHLVVELEVPFSRIDQILAEHKSNVHRQCFEIMKEWRQRQARQATFRNLQQAFRYVGISSDVLKENVN